MFLIISPYLKLNFHQKLLFFRLDIAKQQVIDKKTNVLYALVNNAGIGVGGYIDGITLESMRTTMDINFVGYVAMTKTFLPLLIAKSDSRVINITSIAGFLASTNMSSYCASKFALESFSDCLRREMMPWNLRVSIIEPEFMKTPIIPYRPGWQSSLTFFPLSMMPARFFDLIVFKNKTSLFPASTYKQLKE